MVMVVMMLLRAAIVRTRQRARCRQQQLQCPRQLNSNFENLGRAEYWTLVPSTKCPVQYFKLGELGKQPQYCPVWLLASISKLEQDWEEPQYWTLLDTAVTILDISNTGDLTARLENNTGHHSTKFPAATKFKNIIWSWEEHSPILTILTLTFKKTKTSLILWWRGSFALLRYFQENMWW